MEPKGLLPTPTLHTARLVLRPPNRDDIPTWQRLFNDWEIIQQLSTVVPWPYPDDGVVEHWEQRVEPELTQRSAWHWAIAERERPGQLIGAISVRPGESENGNRGFWLGRPFWGRGYMTEAVTAVQDWVFTETSMEQLRVKNALSNPASRRIKEKTGAEYQGTDTCSHNSGDDRGEVWIIRRVAWRELRGLND